MGKNSLLFYPYGQLLLLMYDARANKKSWTDSYSGVLNKYDDFIVVEAIEVEDQKAIKIDDYGEYSSLLFSPLTPTARCFPPNMHEKLLFWDIFFNDSSRKAIKVPSFALIKIFLL